MALSVQSIRMQLARKPGRSAVLACLVVAFIVLVARELVPARQATALVQPTADSLLATTPQDPTDGLTAEELTRRIATSSRLWQVLHEARGLPPSAVFRLASDYYQPIEEAPGPVATSAAPAGLEKLHVERVDPAVAADAQQQAIRRQAQKLELRSVVLAQDPVAVINAVMVRVGDRIEGFRVIAIQARQVVVEKDGTSVVLDMVH